MAKTLDICKVCKSRKFLNSVGLCKRCMKTPEGLKYTRMVTNKQHAAFEEEQEEAAAQARHDAEVAVEEAPVEEAASEEKTAAPAAEKKAE